MSRVERIKLVKAMEFICRQINDENIFDGWLIGGVADGDIEYGDLSDEDNVDDYYLDNDGLRDLMGCFLRRMKYAGPGGLYCDGVVGDIDD